MLPTILCTAQQNLKKKKKKLYKRGFLTNESNNNHLTPRMKLGKFPSYHLIYKRLQDSTGLEQESYGVNDINYHHKRPRAEACKLNEQFLMFPRKKEVKVKIPPSPNY